jgi:hypothetical protein
MSDCNGQNGQLFVNRFDPPVCVTRDKQLAAINLPAALFKWDHGMACNLKEVAVVTGYYYAQVRRWDLPLFDGKITRSEFLAWKRKKIADTHTSHAKADRPLGPAAAAWQRRLARSKFDRPTNTSGSSAHRLVQKLAATTEVPDAQNLHE